jgi:glyoxylase-like metal-dependent hydrolase (beta-lactamase superfamily II)
MVRELGQGIYRLADEIVNSYVVVEGTEVTIVDAGVPGYWSALPPALASFGRRMEDVRAVILTHGHSDHLGFAEFARRRRINVGIHGLDEALAKGQVPNPARGYGSIRIRPLLGFLWWAARHGGLQAQPLADVATFGDGVVLDVPGSPRVIHVPGHTPGSVAYHFAGHGALFVGDALATYAVTTGARGPQLAPFTADRAAALASLDRLTAVSAPLVLPGHGPEWHGGIEAAVAAVRASAGAARASARAARA